MKIHLGLLKYPKKSDANSDFQLDLIELDAWNASKSIVVNFYVNHCHDHYVRIVDPMTTPHQQLEASINSKMRFLHPRRH